MSASTPTDGRSALHGHESGPASPHARELVAELQFAQLRVRLGLAEALQPIALDSERRFLLLELLGTGGMGVVFLGYDTMLERRVALKVLRRRMHSLAQLEQRLMREAKILANLPDRNILIVYDVGRARTGEPFIATQHVDGPTLREWQVGRSLGEILTVYLEAGRGLAAAHERDIVHRDFKPENVLVEAVLPVKVYVGDFGLSDSPCAEDLAERSTVARLGTPAYMAPEQLQRRPATVLSDQYSFCVALWEACCGARPPSGGASPRPPNMPRWLHRLLVVGLSPRPEDRHVNLGLLLARIEAGRRRRARGLATFSILTLLGVGVGVGFGLGRRPPSCSDAVGIDEPWSVMRAVALQSRLAKMPFDYAPQTAARTVNRLYANVEARRELELATCEARALAPDDPRSILRAQCLERWRERTNEQLEALEQLEPEHLVAAHDLLGPLDTLAELCGRGGEPAPLDAGLQRALVAAENASLLLDHARALDRAEDALELAETHGRACDLGHAHYRLGRTHMLASRAMSARDEFLIAIEHAQSCTDDLEITININLAQLSAVQLGDVDAAKQAIADARGKLDALSEPQVSLTRAWVHETEGFIALAEGHPERAIPFYRRAVDALGGAERHPFQTARMFSNIGAAQQLAGALADARRSNELAHDIVARQLGLDHPEVQTHLRWAQLNEALLARDAGDGAVAEQQLVPLMDAPEPAIRIRATSSWLSLVFDGESTPAQLDRARELVADLRDEPDLPPRVRGEGLSLAGHVLVGGGDEVGFELMREALVLWREHFPNSPDTAIVAVGLAQALRYADRDAEARDACRAVRRLTAPLPAEVSVALTELETELGM